MHVLCGVSVTDHGARGDGTSDDTAALQQAIDAVADGGGGTVCVPAGTYRTGTLRLRNRITLHLDAGAVLLGSDEMTDYGPYHLLYAREAEDVAIVGRGVIHCRSSDFFAKMEEARKREPERWPPTPGTSWWTTPPWRPRSTAHFFKCRNVLVEGVTFVEGAITTLLLLGCDGVALRGLTIDNGLERGLTDAVNLTCSRNVRVSDCHITAEDDPICVYHHFSSFEIPGYEEEENLTDAEAAEDYPSENIVVENCILRTKCNAIRVCGARDGVIRNLRFSNIVVPPGPTPPLSALCIRNFYRLAALAPAETEVPGSTRIEDVSFTGITAHARRFPVLIQNENCHAAGEPTRGHIRNIGISDAVFTSTTHGAYLGGSPDRYLEGIRFDNVTLALTGAMAEEPVAGEAPFPFQLYGGETDRGAPFVPMPYGITCRYAEDVDLGIRVRWAGVSGPWAGALRCDHVRDLGLSRFDSGRLGGEPAAVRLHDTTEW